MPISRLQIPAEVDVFATGGDVNTPSTDQFSQLGAMMMNRFQPFEQNVQKYQQRLAPYAYQAPRMNIYDLASELGAGLLSTPNTGGASAFTGLGVGFTRASERMKADRIAKEKSVREMGMMAAQLAMQDEQKANEFLNQITLKMMGDSNKDVKSNTLSYIDPATNERVERTFDTTDPFYKTILRDPDKYQAAEVTKPLVDMSNQGDQYKKLNDLTAGQIVDRQKKWAEDAEASYAILDKAQYARKVAMDLGEDNFGQLQMWSMGLKNIALGLGMDGLVNEEDLANQQLVNQIGTGFMMSLVGQTKGAISNKEMELFAKASPGLGSTYKGFMKMVDYLEKIAQKSVDLDLAWADESGNMQDDGKSLDQIRARQSQFRAEWVADNPLFEEEDLVADIDPFVDRNTGKIKDKNHATIYGSVSGRHSDISQSTFSQSQTDVVPVAKGVKGVPDGAVFERTVNGKDYYRDQQGTLHIAEE